VTDNERHDDAADARGGGRPRGQPDSEAALQEELKREAREVSGSVGDVSADRNLTGSSTWTTLPEPSNDDGEPAPKRGRPDQQS
jgi:hypothetical protein